MTEDTFTENQSENPLSGNNEVNTQIENTGEVLTNSAQFIVPVPAKNFVNFTYSKRSHFGIFQKNKYDSLFYGKTVRPDDSDIKTYQNLLIFSFITQNIPQGSKILEVGCGDDYIFNHFKYRYEYWRIEDPALLTIDDEVIRNSNHKLLKDSEGNYHSQIPVSFFDFIFSASGFEKVPDDKSLFKQVLDKINFTLKANSFSLHCFPSIMVNNNFHYHRLLNYFSNHSYELFYPVRSLTMLPVSDEMLANKDLHYSLEKFSKARELHLEDLQNTVSYNFLWTKKNMELGEITSTRLQKYPIQNKVYFFHHLVKCGGTSVKDVLARWFKIENDYLESKGDLNKFLKYKINLSELVHESCVVGHFQYEKILLFERYPKLLKDSGKYRLFTFIRDPLQIRFSMFYYNKNLFDQKNINLQDSMKYFPNNYLASLFPCNESNYKEVLDRYFFIGIVEQMQESFDRLAEILKKKKLTLPYLNRSQKDSQITEVSGKFISKFKADNALDYKIYDYCLQKFHKLFGFVFLINSIQ
ncbi:MAG: hypothetical protein ABI840_13145 [bacterium]